MTKFELIRQLRVRQYAFRNASKKQIDAMSQSALLDAYIKCSCCKKRLVDEPELNKCIEDAKNSEDFFRIMDKLEDAHELEMKKEDI